MEPKIENSNGYRVLVDPDDTSRRSSEVKTYKLSPKEIEALLKNPAIKQKKETCYAFDGEKVKEIRKDEKDMKRRTFDAEKLLNICREHGTDKKAKAIIAKELNCSVKQAENLIYRNKINKLLNAEESPDSEVIVPEQKTIEHQDSLQEIWQQADQMFHEVFEPQAKQVNQQIVEKLAEKLKQIPKSEIGTPDLVNNPSHYTFGNVETIDYIKAKFTPEMFEGLCVGAAIQYLSRYKHKGGLEDLKKAQWYLDKIIAVKETA